MIRKAFVMTVNPKDHAEYQRRHEALWPEMKTELKNHGVLSYSIFLQKETNQLFGYLEIEDEELWAKMADTKINRKWWDYMEDIMETNPDHSPVSVDLKNVFTLDFKDSLL
ncbi:L-rhamnose mutarotase [Enterococcus timonensis]|uniref:L-rhamnose mutarotase n=1 Tax=Enterococcus timonensis TaxID=1852364 RepID=UPI0008DA75BE|nr:L-rhamnose mutarotase [Enterococcus timonensis]